MSLGSLDVSDALHGFFGGWPNVMQGVGGAIVAVVGAYAIAVWTSRNELRRDRQRAREDAGVAAAGQLISVIADLPEGIRALENLQALSGTGISYKHVSAWEKRRRQVQEQVSSHGVLLPEELERHAIELVGLLGNLFTVEEDEDTRTLIWVDTAGAETLDGAIAKSEEVLRGLQEYRRDPVRTRKGSGG